MEQQSLSILQNFQNCCMVWFLCIKPKQIKNCIFFFSEDVLFDEAKTGAPFGLQNTQNLPICFLGDTHIFKIVHVHMYLLLKKAKAMY